MRYIYITVLTLLILSIVLFIVSFVYLDKEKHKIYYYTINLEGHDIGQIRIDKFETEDKLIYKSISEIPFFDIYTESKSRFDLDKKYRLESYGRERSGSGVTESIYLENKNGTVSFISKFDSRFVSLDSLPIKRDAFIFEEDSPLTYLPIIENYDFRKGKSQGFNALTCFSNPSLPPMKRFVTLTSIKNEYIEIDSRKIRVENLLLKIRNYPQGSIWVAKSDKQLLKIEIPKMGLEITRCFRPKIIEAKDYGPSSDEYVTREIIFKNKGAQLAGTITAPKKEGAYPAVLLIWGQGPQNREYYGLFGSIADYLSKNGFCVLRFDKRGIGQSTGDAYSLTDSDEIEDINSALEYLKNQKEVDPQNIILIGHAKGAFYALKIASESSGIRAIVLMAPSTYLGFKIYNGWPDELKKMAPKYKWTDAYLKTALRCAQETENKVKSSNRNSAYILGKRCFLKELREESLEKPMDMASKIKIPVFILQGKEDEEVSIEFVSNLDKTLTDSGNTNHTLTYFGYLGHFFGQGVNDGVHKLRYETDKNVLENIKNWLDKVIVKQP